MGEEITWQTEITAVEPNKVVVRGYRIHELIGRLPFSHVVYLLVRGELPTAEQGALLNAVLVVAVDHGATTPSAMAARTVATSGSPNMAAVAAGLMAIHRYHGGDVNGHMQLLYDAVARRHNSRKSAEIVATEIVQELSEAKMRFPGYGDRFHTRDPRAFRLLELTRKWCEPGEFLGMAEAIRGAIMQVSLRDLPINLDGAVAVALCEMGFPAELGNAVFAMSRMVGLTMHVYEEQTQMRPMRKVTYSVKYHGPPERDFALEEAVKLLMPEEKAPEKKKEKKRKKRKRAKKAAGKPSVANISEAVTIVEQAVEQAIQAAVETTRAVKEKAEETAIPKQPVKSVQEIIEETKQVVDQAIRAAQDSKQAAKELGAAGEPAAGEEETTETAVETAEVKEPEDTEQSEPDAQSDDE